MLLRTAASVAVVAALAAVAAPATVAAPPSGVPEPELGGVLPLTQDRCVYEGKDRYEKRVYKIEGWEGPEYERGGDATIRTLLVASHARVFGEALRLPQDIDVMAYAASQQAFYEHVGRTQSIVTGASTPVATGAAAVRTQDRTTGLERG